MVDHLGGAGHNNPPEDTPFEKLVNDVTDLYDEARLWMDGEAIIDDKQAEAVGNMIIAFRNLAKRGTAMHKEEKQPFKDGGKDVDNKYRTVRADIERAGTVCKAVSSKWQIKVENELRAEQVRLQSEADEKERVAQEAIRNSADNIAAREKAERDLKDADAARAVAKKASKATAKVGGSGGRAIGLTTKRTAVITGLMAVVMHYKDTPEMLDLVTKLANRDARAGTQEIPGVCITEERVAR